uniref:Mannosyltransferase n=1 Tax=Peronospora matthiolae TaxID=2874970 RepID=A0AAV1ULH3_9STRA
MVHPDEFFQSQEVIARHFLPKPSALRRELVVPWEFELPTPNRSIVIPALIAGLPYKILELLGIELSGWLLLVTPRLLLCCLSFAFDVILYQIVGKRSSHHKAEVRREKQEKALLLFASSWPTLVFLCRPFSNTLESLALALCFATLFLVNPHRRVLGDVVHVQTFLLGSLLAVGFFTRFTFPVFFFPLGLELVRQQDAQLLQAARKKEGVLALSLVQRFVSTLGVCLQGFVAFLMWAILFVVVDTLYYRPEVLSDESSTSLLKNVASNAVVAPVNNLLYNTQYGNLELHGVHPRVTHLALNVPMLFGPLFFIFLVCCIRFPDRTFFGTACVVFPLACLSLAPHQEPRFLLPAMVPLHIFAVSRDNRSASCFLTEHKLGISLWIVFNFVLTLFFGMLHQGGVVPLLLSLSSIGSASVENSTTAASWLTSFCNFDGADNVTMGMLGSVPLVFAKTYMPPRFLLAGMTAAPAFQVIDLAGKNTVDDDLAELLGADKADRLSEEHRATVFMVLPASVDIRDMVSESSVSIPSMSRLGGCGPHVSTEDFAFDKPFSLELYAVTLASRTWTTLS